MVSEEIVAARASRAWVFMLSVRPQVRNRVELEPAPEYLGNVLARVRVAPVYDVQLRFGIELGMYSGFDDELGQIHRSRDIVAVEPAGEEHHVGPQALEVFDLPVGGAAVIHRDDVEDDGTRAQGHPVRAVGRKPPNEARYHHGEAPSRAGRRKIRHARSPAFKKRVPGRPLDCPDGVENTH